MSTNRTLIESALLDLKTLMAEMAKKEEELDVAGSNPAGNTKKGG